MASSASLLVVHPVRWCGLFLLGIIAHVGTIDDWFVSTDSFALVHSARITDFGDLLSTLTRPLMAGTDFTEIALFYRPVSSLTYAADHAVWGLSPGGYHATNVGLHGLVVVLAAVFVTEVTRKSSVGLVTGVLFALHPMTAEVVPVVARRHDIVMLIFMLPSLTLFIRFRRTDSAPLLWVSVVSYLFAVAAKEPALLTPILITTWVAVNRWDDGLREGLIGSIREAAPFVWISGGYLAVRIAILGGVGGYLHRPSLGVADTGVMVVKYVLSLGYPADPVGEGVTVGGRWITVVFILACVGCLYFWAASRRFRRADWGGWRRVLIPLGCATLAAIPAMFLIDIASLEPLLQSFGYMNSTEVLPFPYPYSEPRAPLIGVALVGAGTLGVLTVWMGPNSIFDWIDRKAIGFFVVWLMLPLGLFVRSGDYAIRSGYPSLVPAMALFGILLVAGLRPAWRHAGTVRDVDVLLVGSVLLLIIPFAVVSPAIHSYDGWEATGRINQLTLTGLDDEVNEVSPVEYLRVIGVPKGIHSQRQAFPRVRSMAYLAPGSIEAWLAMQRNEPPPDVTMDRRVVLDAPPTRAVFEPNVRGNHVAIRVQYDKAHQNPGDWAIESAQGIQPSRVHSDPPCCVIQ